jgi:hypothetical protein
MGGLIAASHNFLRIGGAAFRAFAEEVTVFRVIFLQTSKLECGSQKLTHSTIEWFSQRHETVQALNFAMF